MWKEKRVFVSNLLWSKYNCKIEINGWEKVSKTVSYFFAQFSSFYVVGSKIFYFLSWLFRFCSFVRRHTKHAKPIPAKSLSLLIESFVKVYYWIPKNKEEKKWNNTKKKLERKKFLIFMQWTCLLTCFDEDYNSKLRK